jgi:hypothetical protein
MKHVVITPMESYAEVLLAPVILRQVPTRNTVPAWTPKRDARGNPIYEHMDPVHKRRIVERVEKRLACFIIGG